MQNLLKLIERNGIHGVVVREFSRGMRPENFSDYVLFQALQDTNTLLYLPDGPLDLNSKTGKLVAGLRAIIESAPDYLERDGWLLLEHGADQAEEVTRELVARGLRHVRSHRDLAGHERMTEAQRA